MFAGNPLRHPLSQHGPHHFRMYICCNSQTLLGLHFFFYFLYDLAHRFIFVRLIYKLLLLLFYFIYFILLNKCVYSRWYASLPLLYVTSTYSFFVCTTAEISSILPRVNEIYFSFLIIKVCVHTHTHRGKFVYFIHFSVFTSGTKWKINPLHVKSRRTSNTHKILDSPKLCIFLHKKEVYL